MVKSAADDGKMPVASSSDDALCLLSDKRKLPNCLAVVGKGMRHNNVLLSDVLQADIQRWYPWSGLQYTLNSQTASLLSRLPFYPFTSRQFNYLLTPLPEAFIGWGHKKSYQRAKRVASRQQRETLSIEDGFLRSLDSGVSSRHGLSVVVDDIGIYFDLTHSSRLEQLIVNRAKSAASFDGLDNERAQQLMVRICDEKLSKYNAATYCLSLDDVISERAIVKSTVAREQSKAAKNSLKTHVLLIDQVVGDASIKGAGADKRQFKKMLKTACRNHPDAHIWIKAHPAAKSGYLTRLKLPKNVRLITQALNPIGLLAQVSHVYTVSSHMGFEALMLGKTVHCFGVNWYSGWGLTDDSGAPKQLLKAVKQRRQAFAAKLPRTAEQSKPALLSKRSAKRFSKRWQLSQHPRNKPFSRASGSALSSTLETLFYSAYIDYSHYVDPATKQACAIDTAIDWLLTNRHWQARLEGHLTVYEFSRWKVPFVKAFVNLPRTTLFIKPKPRLKNILHLDHFRVNYQQPLLVWGLAKRQQLQKKLQSKLAKQQLSDIPPIYCMEDGFIRSNGLGATLLAPLSVVIDKQGIYYDATQPSDLETLLRDCEVLTSFQIARVQALRDKLLTQRVSKYNVGTTADSQHTQWVQEAKSSGKPRILIVGQVEDDLSVQYCGSSIQTNSGLIEQVRQDNPDSYLIYKPHPDVEAGLRAGQVGTTCLQRVQAVAYDTAMPDCLECVDEVHTISSLTGFEALLRGLKVVCYGLPFYAGWGLTVDKNNKQSPKVDYLQRRRRHEPLTFEQLLYCTLIRYPVYCLPEGYGLAQVEQVIDYLYPSTAIITADKGADSKAINNIVATTSITISDLSNLPLRLRRHAATRFMQQRHRLQQLLRKQST